MKVNAHYGVLCRFQTNLYTLSYLYISPTMMLAGGITLIAVRKILSNSETFDCTLAKVK